MVEEECTEIFIVKLLCIGGTFHNDAAAIRHEYMSHLYAATQSQVRKLKTEIY
jgi:hypothetical protein